MVREVKEKEWIRWGDYRVLAEELCEEYVGSLEEGEGKGRCRD